MEIKLQGFVFHKILSEQGEKQAILIPRDKEVELPDKNADTLVTAILTSHRSEGNMAYAKIIAESEFDKKTKSYLSGELGFYDYSIDALKQLQTEMLKVPLSTGGFLTIIDYVMNDEQNLMVVLIKNVKGIGITDNLELEEIDTLDIDKLHFAANININRWLNNPDDKKLHYLSFLKGKNRRDTVVGYFKSFLGIDEDAYNDPAKHTEQIVAAVNNYCEKHKTEDEALASRRSIRDWSEAKAAKEETITIREIANQLEPADPQNFIDYLNENEIEIPSEFEPVKAKLTKLVKWKVSGPNKEYTLTFDQEALENKTIYLDKQGHIVITNVPEDIKARLPKRG